MDGNKPVVGTLCSVVPGLGQVYCGKNHRGIIIFLGTFLFAILAGLAMQGFAGPLNPGGVWLLLIPLAIWAFGVIDTYSLCKKMAAGEIPAYEPRSNDMTIFVVGAVFLTFMGIGFLMIAWFLYGLFYLAMTVVQPFSPHPDVSDTELRVLYDAPVYAHYGSVECLGMKEIPANDVFRFASMRGCQMNYAYFNKSLNDTSNKVLRADLVRHGQIIKSYSTEASSIGFNDIDEFLVQSAREPGLVLDVPITVKVLSDDEWGGRIDDKYGGQSEWGNGPATRTLVKPVLPVEACFRNSNDSASSALALELYQGEKLLNRTNFKNEWGRTCVIYP